LVVAFATGGAERGAPRPAWGGGHRRGHAARVASIPLPTLHNDRRPYHLLACSRRTDQGWEISFRFDPPLAMRQWR